MKKSKVTNFLYLLMWLLELAALGFSVATVWRLDMLPDQYILLLVAAALLLWSLSGLLLFLPSRKRGDGKIRRGFGCVFVLLIVLVCAVLTSVVMDLYETMHNIVDDPTGKTLTRGVYVLAEDPAQTLTDAKDYTFARVDGYDSTYTSGAIATIQKSVGQEITVRDFNSVPEMVDALYDGTVDAIILNSAYVTILEENTGHTDFSQRTRLLCQVDVQKEDIPDTPDPTQGGAVDPGETIPTTPEITIPVIENPQDITNTPFVVYVSGSDSRSSQIQDGRSDVNILVVVNPETKQILMINTPRDYYIPNPAGGGRLDKLTHCGNDGISNSMQALSDLYNVPISYYANINFAGFETFIDAIGGVTVYSDYSFSALGTWIEKGENTLNGKQALNFARERYNAPGGDLTRGENQMKVVKAVIQKMTSGTTLISRYAEILDSLSGMFRMNLKVEEISQLVKMQLNDMASWTISSYTVQGLNNNAGQYAYTYSTPGMELWVLPPDYDTVAHASGLIEKIVSGETLTDADLAGPVK